PALIFSAPIFSAPAELPAPNSRRRRLRHSTHVHGRCPPPLPHTRPPPPGNRLPTSGTRRPDAAPIRGSDTSGIPGNGRRAVPEAPLSRPHVPGAGTAGSGDRTARHSVGEAHRLSDAGPVRAG